jgi:integrase
VKQRQIICVFLFRLCETSPATVKFRFINWDGEIGIAKTNLIPFCSKTNEENMGIKFDEQTKTYEVSYTKRHPITGVPYPIRRKNIKSKVEARRVYEELIVLVSEKIKRRIIPSWRAHLDDYFQYLKTTGITNTTIYNREKLLRHHTLLNWEEKLIDEISRDDIFGLLASRLADSSESHKKFFLKCLRGVFQFAIDRQWRTHNPTPVLKFKVNDKIKSVLNEEQIMSLLRNAQEQGWPWYPHYSVAVFTGLRSGELFALKWSNVNLEKRQILVNSNWVRRDGFKSTKSGDDRIVEIPLPLINLLRDLKLKSADSDFVLPRLSRWEQGEQSSDLRLFLKSNGLPQVRFHDLRASWATLLLSKGVAPSQVMAMGGWKDMKTMMIYMRKAGINIKDATSCLDGMQIHGIQGAKVVNFSLK